MVFVGTKQKKKQMKKDARNIHITKHNWRAWFHSDVGEWDSICIFYSICMCALCIYYIVGICNACGEAHFKWFGIIKIIIFVCIWKMARYMYLRICKHRDEGYHSLIHSTSRLNTLHHLEWCSVSGVRDNKVWLFLPYILRTKLWTWSTWT